MLQVRFNDAWQQIWKHCEISSFTKNMNFYVVLSVRNIYTLLNVRKHNGHK